MLHRPAAPICIAFFLLLALWATTLLLNADATESPVLRVSAVYSTSTPFGTIQAAYDDPATQNTDIIRLHAGVFGEEIHLWKPLEISLSGGYEPGFLSNPGVSTVNGFTISAGTVVVGNIAVAVPVCGNGNVEIGEQCDDGNTTDGDGCSSSCQLETGYTCSGSPSICTTTCGDSFIAGNEQCDDGNTASNDGCSSICTVESGFNCTGTAMSICTSICGDGLVVGLEQCDDYNTADNDGCSSTCKIDTGYICTGSPSVCSTVCGDGIKAGAEACDDGNTANGDGCSSTCTAEPGWELEPNDSCVQAEAMPAFTGTPLITSIKGNIRPAADSDFYTFTLAGPGVVSVRIETYFGTVGTCASTDANDTQIELRSATDCNTPLASNDDGIGIGYCSAIDGPAAWDLSPGTYTVRVLASRFQTTPTPLLGYGMQVKIISTCGNGIKETGESCDDGNINSGDGCSSHCMVEAGYACAGTPSVCTLNCGNGSLQTGETCDDGNILGGDGCSAACKTEPGYTCTGTPSVCSFTCGDGSVTGAEQCDDGNKVNGDGCSSTCTIESGYQCSNANPSVCTKQETVCNDGIDNDGDSLTDAADPDCSLPAYFTPCSAGETLSVYRSVSAAQAIPDNSTTGITQWVAVANPGSITRVALLYSITHSWDSDVDIYLTPPGGAALDVSTDNGAGGDNFTNTLLDSTCATAITLGVAPFSGCYKPETAFTALNGTSPVGVWSLKVADDTGADTGTLNSWALILCTSP